MRSRELWKSFEQIHRIELDYRRVGFVIAASDGQSERELARREEFQLELGLDIRDLSMMELVEAFPHMQTEDIIRATYTPEDGYATPADTTKQIMEVARSNGVKVLQNTEVVDILVRNDRIEAVITSPVGPIPCDVVINAAGLFAAQVGALVGIDIPVGAYRQHQYFTEEITSFNSELIPNFMDPALGLYLRGEGHGMLLSVARENDARRLDFVVDESLLNDLAQKMLHRWPYLADFGIASSWVGCYPITPDSRAIVGDVPGIQGFYNAAGLGGHGFMHGFATGEAICSLISDGKWGFIDLSEFALDRFRDDYRNESASPLAI
jgi:sarcosine oxidase subunit beta